jgi:hypothetical protein
MGSTSSHGSRVYGSSASAGGERGRAVSKAEVAEDFLDHGALVNDRNHPHLMLALWADERVGVPHLENEIAPFFRGQFGGPRRGW